MTEEIRLAGVPLTWTEALTEIEGSSCE